MVALAAADLGVVALAAVDLGAYERSKYTWESMKEVITTRHTAQKDRQGHPISLS